MSIKTAAISPLLPIVIPDYLSHSRWENSSKRLSPIWVLPSRILPMFPAQCLKNDPQIQSRRRSTTSSPALSRAVGYWALQRHTSQFPHDVNETERTNIRRLSKQIFGSPSKDRAEHKGPSGWDWFDYGF